MSGWIKFDKDMADDPRLLEIAVAFATDAHLATGNTDMPMRDAAALFGNAVRGALLTLFCYADTHIHDDDTLDLSTIAIDAMVGLEGFCDSLPAEWLQETDENRVLLPGYCEKNNLISKKKRRASAAERQRRFKQRQRGVTKSVTKGVGNAVSTPSPRVVDQDLDHRPRPEDRKSPTDSVPLSGTTSPQIQLVPDAIAPADTVLLVFEHWKATHNHPRSQLDDKRRKLIRNALTRYSEADLCQAISGYRNSPHHMGDNDRGAVYDDIELLLRDSKHVDAGLKFYAEPPSNLSAKSRQLVRQTEDWEPPEARSA